MTKPKLQIGLCGSHGTGKSTLAKDLVETLNKKGTEVFYIEKTMRTMWKSYGIDDFEKLPSEVRSIFQMHAILNQIEKEDQKILENKNFVTDRTVLDNLGYTILSSDMTQIEIEVYRALVKERLKNYTHFIFVPVEFDAEAEHLRADPKTQKKLNDIFEKELKKLFPENNYLRVSGNEKERLEQVLDFLTKN